MSSTKIHCKLVKYYKININFQHNFDLTSTQTQHKYRECYLTNVLFIRHFIHFIILFLISKQKKNIQKKRTFRLLLRKKTIYVKKKKKNNTKLL